MQNRKHQNNNNNNNNKRRKKKTTSVGLCKRDREKKGRRRPPVWVRAREREKKKVMQEREEKVVYVKSASVGPTIFNIFTTMPPSIVTQKLKTAREVYTVFKHHKLRIVTQTPLVKHSYQTLFFLKSRCKNIKELEKTTNLRWNEEL